jgi:hypothetical protein
MRPGIDPGGDTAAIAAYAVADIPTTFRKAPAQDQIADQFKFRFVTVQHPNSGERRSDYIRCS